MAYIATGLNPGAGNSAGGPFMSSYTTVDAAATVEGAGYFNDAADILDNNASQGVLVVLDTNAPTTIMYGYRVAAGVVTVDVPNKKLLD